MTVQSSLNSFLETNAPEKSARFEGAIPSTAQDLAQCSLYLRATSSFFSPGNHPFTEPDLDDLLSRDWASEVRIARGTLVRCSELLAQAAIADSEVNQRERNADTESLEDLYDSDSEAVEFGLTLRTSLSEICHDFCALTESELDRGPIDIHSFATLGKILRIELQRASPLLSMGAAVDVHWLGDAKNTIFNTEGSSLERSEKSAVYGVVHKLADLLTCLGPVEEILTRDLPMKQALPFFTLINEECRSVLQRVEGLTAREVETEGNSYFDSLDGLKFAVSMEMRKVFGFELVGLSSNRHAPALYTKVENAHGLLRDSFQQSIVGLLNLFDPSLTGDKLFTAFHTKLEQSLAIRRDLWTLLQLVRRAEEERDLYPIARLIDQLNEFRDGSLRYLMFKDWEACERFIEEVGAARGAIELAPVLNRFSAYLETLHGQVNMRAVLADHPFEYQRSEA